MSRGWRACWGKGVPEGPRSTPTILRFCEGSEGSVLGSAPLPSPQKTLPWGSAPHSTLALPFPSPCRLCFYPCCVQPLTWVLRSLCFSSLLLPAPQCCHCHHSPHSTAPLPPVTTPYLLPALSAQHHNVKHQAEDEGAPAWPHTPKPGPTCPSGAPQP